MKKLLKFLLIVIVIVVAFILIVGIFVSKNYHLEKDITINAQKEKVWSNVSTLHGMEKWSPWLSIDPNVVTTYEGQDGTVGALYKWKGNKDVGSGEQTLTKIEPTNNVTTHLHFIEPFDGEADAYINLADAGSGTKATWGLDMKYAYPMNVMLLFINMDDMMGKQYNAGLEKLKTICETN